MILLIWILSFFFMSLIKELSILFFVLNHHLLFSSIFCNVFLASIYFLSDIYYLLPSTNFVILPPLCVRLDCLFDTLLVVWSRPILLLICFPQNCFCCIPQNLGHCVSYYFNVYFFKIFLYFFHRPFGCLRAFCLDWICLWAFFFQLAYI